MIYLTTLLPDNLTGSQRNFVLKDKDNLVLSLDYDSNFLDKDALAESRSRNLVMKNTSSSKNKKGLLTVYELIQNAGDYYAPLVTSRNIKGIDLSNLRVVFINPNQTVLVQKDQLVAKISMKPGRIGCIDEISWFDKNHRIYKIDQYSVRGFLSRTAYLDREGLTYLERYYDPTGKTVAETHMEKVVQQGRPDRTIVGSIEWVGHGVYRGYLEFLNSVWNTFYKNEEFVISASAISVGAAFKDHLDKMNIYVDIPLTASIIHPNKSYLNEIGSIIATLPQVKLLVPTEKYKEILGHLFKNKIEVSEPSTRKPTGKALASQLNKINAISTSYNNDSSILDMINAWRIAVGINPNKIGVLSIYGFIDDKLKEKVTSYVTANNLTANVRINGFSNLTDGVYFNNQLYLQTKTNDISTYAKKESNKFGLKSIGFKSPLIHYDYNVYDVQEMAQTITNFADYTIK